MKKYSLLWGLLLLIIGCFFWKNNQLSPNDFRIAEVSDNGWTLVSVSKERRMVNSLKVSGDVELWIPRGLGWYKSNKVMALLTQEKKTNLIPEVLFYNYGFVPDVVIEGNGEKWLSSWQVINKWGWVNYVWYRFNQERILQRVVDSSDNLEEILPRDFADSFLLKEVLRVSVYNGGMGTGLAKFMARDLEWAGLTVVGVDNFQDKIDKCDIKYGRDVDKSFGFIFLKKRFPECHFEPNDKLGKMEAEIYLGDNYTQMLNYQSYVRSL